MIPWELLDRAPIPGSADELLLWRRGDEFSIRISGYASELMNSRLFTSEQMLAKLACAVIAGRPALHVLIGGLGMGFTLGAALGALGAQARVTVAELVPQVVEWNRGPLGERTGRPLDDARCEVRVADVAAVLRGAQGRYDAVLLDVDNGPEGMTHAGNGWLYGAAGLGVIRGALTPGGVLAVWSAEPDPAFEARLARAGFAVTPHIVRARPGKGARHTIWLARTAAR